MIGYTDDEVEKKLRWKITEDDFPADPVYYYSDALAARKIPHEMQMAAAMPESGKPVVAIIGNETYWTLISTNVIVSSSQLGVSRVFLDHIEQFSPNELETLPKQQLHILEITTTNSDMCYLWAPPGTPFGLLMGVVLFVKRMRKR